MNPFSFLSAVREGLREMIENETDPRAKEFFSRVGKMTGVKGPVVPKNIVEGEVTGREMISGYLDRNAGATNERFRK